MSSPQQKRTGDLVYSCHPEASSVMLRVKHKHDALITKKMLPCRLVLYEQLLVEGAYRPGQTQRCVRICVSCETRLKVSGCDWSAPEPPSGWMCWAGTQTLNPGIAVRSKGKVSAPRLHRNQSSHIHHPWTRQTSHLVCCDLWLWFFNAEFSALFCSYFSVTAEHRRGLKLTVCVCTILIEVRKTA